MYSKALISVLAAGALAKHQGHAHLHQRDYAPAPAGETPSSVPDDHHGHHGWGPENGRPNGQWGQWGQFHRPSGAPNDYPSAPGVPSQAQSSAPAAASTPAASTPVTKQSTPAYGATPAANTASRAATPSSDVSAEAVHPTKGTVYQSAPQSSAAEVTSKKASATPEAASSSASSSQAKSQTTLATSATSSSAKQVSSQTQASSSAAAAAGGDKLPAGATPFTAVKNPSGAPAIPKPTTGFSVDTYWGGDKYPFVLSHDQAPKMNGSDYVELHNQYRKLHGATPMVLNETLQTEVNGWVDKCYGGDPHAGSNWYEGTNGSPADALYSWYNERGNWTALTNDYTVTCPGETKCNDGSTVNPPDVGHFSQMVWNASTSVACANKKCPQSGWPDQVIHICLYYPAGNAGFNDEPTDLYNVYRPSS